MEGKNKQKLRKKIRGIIKELFQSHTHFSKEYPQAGSTFPYHDKFAPVNPDEINTDINYYQAFNAFAGNDDTYDFPFDEFKKGIQMEKKVNPDFNLFQIAEIVIDNLKENKYFYSNKTQSTYEGQ